MKKKVYLAGPMCGLEWTEGQIWRKKAEELLGEHFEVLSPYAGREEKETMPDRKSIVVRDKKFVREADVIIVNDEMDLISIGTSMEIMYAYDREKIILVFGKAHQGNVFMDYHITSRYNTLEELCENCILLYA